MRDRARRLMRLAVWFVFVPTAVFGQAGVGGFSGVVRDTSGAVLPGVTVEASSDALIEKTRTVVTDGQGRYNVADLRPGTYVLTFSLTGFSTVRREGLELSSGVTLPYNAEMKVGALEETLTVTGETPVVDVTTTRNRVVMGREVLDSIPRSRDPALTAALLPGVNNAGLQDLGGSGGGVIASISAHGSDGSDQNWSVDGMKAGNSRRVIAISDQASSEVTFETSGISAETQGGGVRMNTVPKEGGNKLSGAVAGAYSGDALTSDNLTDELKARGLTAVGTVTRIWDVSPALGGPIRQDSLWFFANYRHLGSDGLIAGAFFDEDPKKQAPNPNRVWDANMRLTWQASARNKIALFYDKQGRAQANRFVSALQSPNAGTGTYYPAMYIAQGRWTAPLTSRLLVEAAASYYNETQNFYNSPAWVPGTYPHLEITTNKLTGAATGGWTWTPHKYWNVIGNVSYVTGSHAFKVGIGDYFGHTFGETPEYLPTLRFNNGVPFQATLSARPTIGAALINYDAGIYAQDLWTLHRVTLNLGIRLDLMKEGLREQNVPAGTYVPARHADAITDMPKWQDLNPRLGFSWDLFGTGKTAIKASYSRYLKQEYAGFPGSVNPISAASDTRTWADTNNDGIPQLSELGPSTNVNFGKPAIVTLPTDDVRLGWHKRPYNNEYAVSVQHEILPGLGGSVGYYRRSYGNFTVTDNTLIDQSDYTPFTIVSPIDGERITMYNLNPAKRGQSLNVITFAPDDSRVFDGVDFTVNGRFGRGVTVNGGVTTGRIAQSICATGSDDPNRLRFCEYAPKFFAQNQYKAIFVLPPMYGIRISGTVQNLPGLIQGALGSAVGGFENPGIGASYTVTSAIAGQTLTNGSITTQLIEPGQQFPERRTQVDLRITRRFQVGRARYDPSIDFYNLFNASTVTSENTQYGPLWRRNATSAMLGRVIQLSMNVTF